MGLLRPSFVPPPQIRVLRACIRHIWDLTADRTRYWQRLEKLLEDALCKLTSVVSRLAGHQTARAVIEAMIAGERDRLALAALGQGRMRNDSQQRVLHGSSCYGPARLPVSDEQRRRGRTAATGKIFGAGHVRLARGRSSLMQIRPREGRRNQGGPMTDQSTTSPGTARFERTYDAPVELIWELWTTAAGLKEWFAFDGFETRVSELDLRPGGQLLYTMTATAPETVSFIDRKSVV